VRGHLVKARFDNERQEWVMEVFTHDENGPLERPHCIMNWESYGDVYVVTCETVMCAECRAGYGWDKYGHVVWYCACDK
jgi:hypothetical protein